MLRVVTSKEQTLSQSLPNRSEGTVSLYSLRLFRLALRNLPQLS